MRPMRVRARRRSTPRSSQRCPWKFVKEPKQPLQMKDMMLESLQERWEMMLAMNLKGETSTRA